MFTSVPYQEKMLRQLGSGGRPTGGGLKSLKSIAKIGKSMGSAAKKALGKTKSVAKKGKAKFDKKLPPGSMKRKATMLGLGLGAEYAASSAIDKWLGSDAKGDSQNRGYFAKHAPSAEKRRKIYDSGLSLMESELNRRGGRTDATSEKLAKLHKYFDARRKGRREDLFMGRPPRLAGGKKGKKKKKGKGKKSKKKGGKKKKGKKGKKKKGKKKKSPKKKKGGKKKKGSRGMNVDAAAAQWRDVRKVFKI